MSWLRRLLNLAIGSRARLIGEDLKGNKYFEEISERGRKTKRSVKVKELQRLEEYDQETVPPEWDRWLRGLAKDPPSTEEQARRAQQSQVLKHRIADLQHKDTLLRDKEIEEGLVADLTPGTKAVDHASAPSYDSGTKTSKDPTSTGKDFTPGSWKPQ